VTSSAPAPAWHVADEVLSRYAAGSGTADMVWSVEAHLMKCPVCRTGLAAHVEPDRLARNRAVLLTRAAGPDQGRTRRLLCRCGIPDHIAGLLGATPSLRLSWLLSVIGVLALVAGEAVLVRHGWIGHAGQLSPAANPAALVPFMLVAPLLVLAGVAAAFLPMLDPSHQLAVAAPFPGFTLLLIRAISALVAALVPVAAAALVLPGPAWLPLALLLPTLALCSLALASATLLPPRIAALSAAAAWALPVLLLAARPLRIVQPSAQIACAAVLCASAVVLLARRDRFELGWTR